MTSGIRRGWVLAVFCVCAFPVLGADRVFSIGRYGRFHLDVPTGWKVEVWDPKKFEYGTLQLAPEGDTPLVLLVSPVPMPDAAPLSAKEFLAKQAKDVIAGLRETAEEQNIEARDVASRSCAGFYASATDRTVTTPTREDFKYATQGALVCGRSFAGFTILTNLASGPEREQALTIVRSASYESTDVPVPTRDGTVAIQFPQKAWRVLIDLPGFLFEPTIVRPDGSGVRLMGDNKKTGVMITAYLESSFPELTAVEHREKWWKQLEKEMPSTDIRRSEGNGMARLDRIVPEFQGKKVQQKNVNVYAVRDGLWLDVHLSKVDYKPADETLFDTIVKTIRFVD